MPDNSFRIDAAFLKERLNLHPGIDGYCPTGFEEQATEAQVVDRTYAAQLIRRSSLKLSADGCVHLVGPAPIRSFDW